jgi:hypothetical protein
LKPGVEFKNYAPGAAMESLCDRLLQDIVKAAPGEAAISLQVEQLENQSFSSRVEVRSKMGSFLGRGQDVFDSVAASKAAKHLMDSLTLWKQGRFGDSSAKVG